MDRGSTTTVTNSVYIFYLVIPWLSQHNLQFEYLNVIKSAEFLPHFFMDTLNKELVYNYVKARQLYVACLKLPVTCM
jgi:hypothetical protein